MVPEVVEVEVVDLGLLDRATTVLGFLPEELLTAYLCAADVVVLPYRPAFKTAM